ncbi:MAG: glycosyltransferase [Desulfomonilaceae bacterium]
MKILYISDGFPNLRTSSSGIGTAVFNAAAGMASRGHEVRLLCAGSSRETTVVEGVVVHTFEVGLGTLSGENPYRDNLAIVRKWSDEHLAEVYEYWCKCVDLFSEGFIPDIIECHDWRALAYFYIHHRLLRYPEALSPIVTCCHISSKIWNSVDRKISFGWDNFLVGERECYQMSGSDALSAPSAYMSELIHSRYHLPKPAICYNNSPHARPESLLPSCDNDELLFLGELRYINGITHLLKVCSYLWNEGLRFTLNVTGPSELYEAKNQDMAAYLEATYAKYIARDLLRIWPNKDNYDEIKDLFARSRAVIQPALMEPLGPTCIEAMSYGRPVIASANGGLGEIIEPGKSGFIYHTLEELEFYIRRILRATRADLEEWGTHANQRACEIFSGEKALPVREQFYGSVIEDSKNVDRRSFPNCSFLSKSKFDSVPDLSPSRSSRNYVTGLLTVVVSCYNLGAFLEEAVESIFRSTYRPIELVVVDDGSEDPQTQEVLNALESSYPSENHFSLRMVRSARNMGLAEVRNLGAEIARGQFVSFVDADDKVEPEFFQKAVAVLSRYSNVGFVGGWNRRFGLSTGNWIITNFDFPLALVRDQGLMSSVIRHEAYERQTVPVPGDDYEGFIAIAEKGWAGVNLPEVVLNYRVRSTSLLHSSHSNSQKLVRYDIMTNHIDLIRAYGDELYLIFCQNYLLNDQDLEHSAQLEPLRHFVTLRDSSLFLLRYYASKPAHILKSPYVAAKAFLPERFKLRIRRFFGVPRGKNFVKHVRGRWKIPRFLA